MPVEAADVIVRAVNDFDDGSIQDWFEGGHLLEDNRVDDIRPVAGGNLNKAKLLGIAMEAVGLGIEGDVSRAEHRLDGSVKLGGLADDFNGKGAPNNARAVPIAVYNGKGFKSDAARKSISMKNVRE